MSHTSVRGEQSDETQLALLASLEALGITGSGQAIVKVNSTTLANVSLGISNITGFIQAGTNITISGAGTLTSPYVISASGSAAGGVTSIQIESAALRTGAIQFIAEATGTPGVAWGNVGQVVTLRNTLTNGISGGQTIIFGTGVGDGGTYKGTIANGTATAAAHIFVGGNNGATEIMRMLNNSTILMGGTTVFSSIGQKLEITGQVPLVLRNISSVATGESYFVNDLASGARAMVWGYTGSAYASVRWTNGPNGEQGYVGTTGNKPFGIFVNSSQIMTFLGTGRVGIMTPSPGNTVEINSSIIGTTGLRFSQVTSVPYVGIDGSGDLAAAATPVVTLTSSDGSITVSASSGNVDITTASGNTHWLYVKSQFDKNADPVLADVTDLLYTIASKGIFSFKAEIWVNADTIGGLTLAMMYTGGLNSIIYGATIRNDVGAGTVVASIRQTTIGAGGAFSTSGATGYFVTITGTIDVGSTGDLTVQFAQFNPNGTSSVMPLSTLVISFLA